MLLVAGVGVKARALVLDDEDHGFAVAVPAAPQLMEVPDEEGCAAGGGYVEVGLALGQ